MVSLFVIELVTVSKCRTTENVMAGKVLYFLILFSILSAIFHPHSQYLLEYLSNCAFVNTRSLGYADQ